MPLIVGAAAGVYARGATYVVAASNSQDKTNADYFCDGTADEVQINAAIAALPASVGGTVLLLEGTYTVAATITLASNTTLAGCGYGTLVQAAGGVTVVTGSSKSGVTIKNIQFVHTSGGAGHLVTWTTVTNSMITNCFFTNAAQQAINLSTACDNNVIADNHIVGSTNIAISLWTADNNTVVGNNVSTGAEGISLGGGSIGNTVSGNVIDTNGTDAIELLGANTNYNTISGNAVFNPGNQGIECITSAHYNTIVGNLISGAGRLNNTFSAIYNTTTQCVIMGNICDSTTQKFGIEVTGSKAIIIGNQIRRYATGSISIGNPNNIVFGNIESAS